MIYKFVSGEFYWHPLHYEGFLMRPRTVTSLYKRRVKEAYEACKDNK